ncbi:MAG: hypothetical protein IT359_07120 [Gemmatimonadaceae bacterium]|nr:hypothetical protein [Gemmatimonadaceae bacterium]
MSPTPARAVAVGAASVLFLVALRAASFIPTTDARGDSAWVRLSWSARPERVEHCRRLSDEELEARPAHMRLRFECEGRFARYELRLTVDDSVAVRDVVQGDGLRHDRPMHVLREHALRPGERHLLVTLARLDSATATAQDSIAGTTGVTGEQVRPGAESDTVLGEREGREREERARRAAESIPARLSLDTTITLGAGRVVLVTYDGARRVLVARTGSASP